MKLVVWALSLLLACRSALRAELPSCEDGFVSIAYFGDSLRSCLHIDDGPLPPVRPSNASCEDSPWHGTVDTPWHDGVNGCAAFARERGWCEQYGSQRPPNGAGRALIHCCTCGGGSRLQFGVGDEAEVPQGPGAWLKVTVAALRPRPGVAYLVSVKGAGGRAMGSAIVYVRAFCKNKSRVVTPLHCGAAVY